MGSNKGRRRRMKKKKNLEVNLAPQIPVQIKENRKFQLAIIMLVNKIVILIKKIQTMIRLGEVVIMRTTLHLHLVR